MSHTLIITDGRAEWFAAVLGSNVVQVTTLQPLKAEIPGFDTPQLVYLLDLDALTPEQLVRVVTVVAAQSTLDPAGFEQRLREHGFAILARGTVMHMEFRPQGFSLDVVFPSGGPGTG